MTRSEYRNKARSVLVDLLQHEHVNSVQLTKRNAKTEDIIFTIESAFPAAVQQTKEIAPFFKRKTDLETVYAVWLFERKTINYVKDRTGVQEIRRPNKFLYDNIIGDGGGDCKSYALFAAAILFNLGFEVGFEYAMYQRARSYSHVYCVAKKNGVLYICDGVLRYFNERKKPYIAIKTHYMDTYILGDDEQVIEKEMQKIILQHMATPAFKGLSPDAQRRKLVQMKKEIQRKVQLRLDAHAAAQNPAPNSVNDGDIGAAKKKLTPEEKKARRKKRNAKVKDAFKKIGRGLMTVTLGVGRGAFLACLAMNLNGMGNKFQALQQKKQFGKMMELWKNLGGIPKVLEKTIIYAAKKKPIFLSKKAKAKFKALGLHGDFDEGVGAAPLAALAALAAPVFGTLIPLMIKELKKVGMHKEAEQVATGGQSIVDSAGPVVTQQLQAQNLNPADYIAPQAGAAAPAEAEEAEEPAEPSADGISEFDFTALASSLGNLASAGVVAAGTAIQNKVNKKKGQAKTLQNSPPIPDEAYMQKLQVQYQPAFISPAPKKKATKKDFMSAYGKYIAIAAGVLAVGSVGYVVLKKKK